MKKKKNLNLKYLHIYLVFIAFRNEGVIIEGIEPGGRIDRDGRLAVGDRITAINGLKLSKDSYRNAHNMLKDAMKAPELSIHCIKKESSSVKHSENSSVNEAFLSKVAPSTPKKNRKDESEELDKGMFCHPQLCSNRSPIVPKKHFSLKKFLLCRCG